MKTHLKTKLETDYIRQEIGEGQIKSQLQKVSTESHISWQQI